MTRRDLVPSRRVLVPASATAVLLFLSYPPASLVVTSFACLVPLLWALEEESRARIRSAFWTGFWFGLIANGAVLYWMVVALWHFTPLSLLGFVASILILGMAWGGMAELVVRARRLTSIPLWVVFPLAWTTVEWVIAHLPDVGFPWLGLGTSLTRVPILVQWAELAGARGVTLWLAWANVMVFLALRSGGFGRAWRPAAALAVSAASALGHGAWRERSLPVRPVATVAVIQPNVDYEEKRRNRDNDSLVQNLLELTRRAREDEAVRLVVWPEAVVPDFFYRHADWDAAIGALAKELGTPLLVGGLDLVFAPDGSYEYYNAAFFYDTTGSARGSPVYHKRYLVPIVERVPFLDPRWFGNLQYFGGFGIGRAFPVYRVDGGGFGAVICYESAFEDLARRYRRAGADFLVNITNDSWYGRTAAPYQHAAHLVMRAIETRMGIARSASTGISQFVDPLGYTHGDTPLFTVEVVAMPVLTTDATTLYVRWGDWVGLLVLVGTAACMVALFIRRAAPGATQ